jgi:hypothetical protein
VEKMDFRQANQTPVNRPEVTAAAPATPHGAKKVKGSDGSPQWLSWLNVVILFGTAILLTLIAFSFEDTSNFLKTRLNTGTRIANLHQSMNI